MTNQDLIEGRIDHERSSLLGAFEVGVQVPGSFQVVSGSRGLEIYMDLDLDVGSEDGASIQIVSKYDDEVDIFILEDGKVEPYNKIGLRQNFSGSVNLGMGFNDVVERVQGIITENENLQPLMQYIDEDSREQIVLGSRDGDVISLQERFFSSLGYTKEILSLMAQDQQELGIVEAIEMVDDFTHVERRSISYNNIQDFFRLDGEAIEDIWGGGDYCERSDRGRERRLFRSHNHAGSATESSMYRTVTLNSFNTLSSNEPIPILEESISIRRSRNGLEIFIDCPQDRVQGALPENYASLRVVYNQGGIVDEVEFSNYGMDRNVNYIDLKWIKSLLGDSIQGLDIPDTQNISRIGDRPVLRFVGGDASQIEQGIVDFLRRFLLDKEESIF